MQGKPGSGVSSAAFSRFLLNTDLPIFLEAPLQKPDAAPAASQLPPASGTDTGEMQQQQQAGHGPLCQPVSLAVLRRIWVQTPPSGVSSLFACRPVVELHQTAPLQLPPEAVEALAQDQHYEPSEAAGGIHTSIEKPGEGNSVPATPAVTAAGVDVAGGAKAPGPAQGTARGDASRGGSASGCTFHVAPAAEVRLPPDSLCIVTLPLAYTAPLAWLASPQQQAAAARHPGGTRVLCPLVPVRDAWPFEAKLLKGTFLFPTAPPPSEP